MRLESAQDQQVITSVPLKRRRKICLLVDGSMKYGYGLDMAIGILEYFSGIEKPESRAERGTLCLVQRLLNIR